VNNISLADLQTDAGPEDISGYRFNPEHLRVNDRKPGVSAFMRIRNGADWLELSVRSHIEFFDEIVAVYNQCTDATPEILKRLQREFGPKRLRIYHYLDTVFPPGSEGHALTDPDSPASLVNYYNFALASTRYQYVTKLDDDHLCIEDATRSLTEAIRSGRMSPDIMYCFSGLNLFRGTDGRLGILRSDPVSGGGDIGFFPVTPQTYFTHDRRFERFQRGTVRREFAGFLYWHLKYLKRDMGFGNYELEKNPQSRYAKRHSALQNGEVQAIQLKELADICAPGLTARLFSLLSEKSSLINSRNGAIRTTFSDESVRDAIERTTQTEFHAHIF
jgi:hypothetical protein